MDITLNLDRQVHYKGIHYEVVDILDNNLLLVVVKEDIDNEKFPLTTFIVPDDIPHY